MQQIKRILATEDGKIFYVKDLNADFHCQFGFVKKTDLKKKTGKVKTNTGKELSILSPSFIDCYKRIKRGPQIIPRKDIGFIVAETGIDNKSKVLDAGTGSGALTLFLANICKEVISYEIRNDFYNIAKSNIEFLGMKNVKIYNKNIYDGITEKNLDLITLDLPEPWLAVKHAEKALKAGGFLVSYSPTIPQVSDFVNEVKKNRKLFYIKTAEIILRDWDVEGRKIRPKSEGIGHSGFMSLCRKTSS
ncbi:methyltransferase domain-containing protein [Candidatus Woesearchaeota archaeon]|nr:methyltransferase domain-containing protein [Candidatus Woesearchaeota archaeon]